jgi:hypothetical protein
MMQSAVGQMAVISAIGIVIIAIAWKYIFLTCTVLRRSGGIARPAKLSGTKSLDAKLGLYCCQLQ